MMAAITETPVVPIRWGSEQKGMQTGGEIENMGAAERIWLGARDTAVRAAQALAGLGVHKSICNRLTEPFMWITVITTATEWKNLFRLRCHPDAEIHFQKIAGMIQAEMEVSPRTLLNAGEWHLPLVAGHDLPELSAEFTLEEIKKISVARCARVSYLTHDGQRDPRKDIDLFDKLSTGSGFGHWCYDRETDVLTDQGWLPWADAHDRRQSLRLAAVNPRDQTISFEAPSHWIAEQYEGRMYSLDGQALNQLVTPNHRLVVSHRESGGTWTPFVCEEAREVFGSPVRHLKSGFLSSAERRQTSNPWGYAPREFAALVAFFCGDGNAEANSANAIYFNLRMPRKIDFLLSIDSRAERTESGKWVVRGEGIARWFRENCYTADAEKRLPESYLFATDQEFLGLMDGFRNSDGSVKRKTWHYDTTSLTLAGQFQSLLHLNGLAAGWSVTRHSEKCDRWKDRIRLNVSERITPRVETNTSNRARTYHEGWEFYSGLVYCATVSTGCLMIRRRGLVSVSGNSPMEHVAQACAEPIRSGPFVGWKQFRKEFPLENSEG